MVLGGFMKNKTWHDGPGLDDGGDVAGWSRVITLGPTVNQYMKIMAYKNSSDATALYTHYILCSVMQMTNQIKATIRFCVKGLHISERRVRAAKQVLKELGLIRDVCLVDHKTGKAFKWYVEIVFLSKKQTRQAAATNYIQRRLVFKKEEKKIHPVQNSKGGLNGKNNKKLSTLADIHPSQIGQGKCLKAKVNLNAYRDSKESIKDIIPGRVFKNHFSLKRNPRIINRNIIKRTKTDPFHPINKFYLNCAQQLKDTLENKYDQRQFPKAYNWVKDFRLIVQSDFNHPGKINEKDKNRILIALNYYCENIDDKYSLIIQCGKTFREKFQRLEEAQKKNLSFQKSNENDNGHNGYQKFKLEG